MQRITNADPEARSADIVAENIEQLKALFPETFTEGRIDFEVLKQLLGGMVEEREEKFGLNWHGKRQARQLALTPSIGTLRPCPEESVDWDTTQNLMIEGDNLEVLKLLQKSYAGKVKLIYIDPPYNKGKDFVYPDDFHDGIQNYLLLTKQIDGEGRSISSNTEASGRFHTRWLNMMYPRLMLARNLLREDGAIFISIDEKELHNLRQAANEVFGEENFIADVTVVTNMKGRNDQKHIASCHEHVIIYGKAGFISYGLPLTEEQRAAFRYEDEDGNKYALRDLRKRGGPDKRIDRPNMFFPIFWNRESGVCALERQSEDDIEIVPMRGDGSEGRWRWGREKVSSHLRWLHPKVSERSGRLDVDHRVYLDPNIMVDEGGPEEEIEEAEDEIVERTSKPKSIWFGGEFSSDNGKRALKDFLPGDSFDFPKSVELIRQCLQIGLDKEGIVMDFFAGSGTIGQAVFTQNVIDSGNRRFILVQLPEPLDPMNKDQKAAADFCDHIGKPRKISELTKERLRRSKSKIMQDLPMISGDLGFRVFKLDTSNIRTWVPDSNNLEQTLLDHIDHITPDRTEQDVLCELLLKLGLDLCVPIETRTIAGKDVHSVGGGVLFACLATEIARADAEPLTLGIAEWRTELAPAGESTVVFRDSAFDGDVTKTNLAAILQQHGLENVRSL